MEVDTREAQKAGLLRPLVRREIELHMADFGLEPEFVTYVPPPLDLPKRELTFLFRLQPQQLVS